MRTPRVRRDGNYVILLLILLLNCFQNFLSLVFLSISLVLLSQFNSFSQEPLILPLINVIIPTILFNYYYLCFPVACSTVTVTKCQAALKTLQAFSFFRPTCLCKEPHVDPECNSFQNFLFDHPCIYVLKKGRTLFL